MIGLIIIFGILFLMMLVLFLVKPDYTEPEMYNGKPRYTFLREEGYMMCETVFFDEKERKEVIF